MRPEYLAFRGERVSIAPTGMEITDPSVHMLRNGDEIGRENPGVSLVQTTLLSGRHGGYQAINFAALAGGNPILLLGYDMKHDAGRDHFEGGGHPVPTTEADLKAYAKRYRTMVEPLRKIGVTVLNCTPSSALTCFPMVSLEEALEAQTV